MSFISKIKKYFYQKSIANLRGSTPANRVDKMTFASAKKVLVLFDANHLDVQTEILNYQKRLKEQGKKVAILGFFNDKESRENLSFSYFNKKNIDWAGRVKGSEIAPFLSEDYDLLVNANLISDLPTEHLICQLNARLKAGPASDNTQVYDLMIDLPANSSISTLLTQIEFYLKKINVKNTVAV